MMPQYFFGDGQLVHMCVQVLLLHQLNFKCQCMSLCKFSAVQCVLFASVYMTGCCCIVHAVCVPTGVYGPVLHRCFDHVDKIL